MGLRHQYLLSVRASDGRFSGAKAKVANYVEAQLALDNDITAGAVQNGTRVGLPSIYRILHDLEERGFLVKVGRHPSRWGAGPRVSDKPRIIVSITDRHRKKKPRVASVGTEALKAFAHLRNATLALERTLAAIESIQTFEKARHPGDNELTEALAAAILATRNSRVRIKRILYPAEPAPRNLTVNRNQLERMRRAYQTDRGEDG